MVLEEWDHSAGFVLMLGAETLDEAAFALAILLNARLLAFSKSFVVSGAARPWDQQGYDGLANLVDAAQVLLLVWLFLGLHASMCSIQAS